MNHMMSSKQTASEELAADGLLTEIQQRLLAERDLALLPGTWTSLAKAGLRGRERWQCSGLTVEPFYVKRYWKIKFREQWDRFFRQTRVHSRSWWEYTQCAQLNDSGIRAPLPLGVAESMCGGFERKSAICLGAVSGEAIDRFWKSAATNGDPRTAGRYRVEFVRALARFVSAFHQTGRCHRDLYLCHVFVTFAENPDAGPQFSIIDLARVHFPTLRHTRWIIKDLSQLDHSAREIGATRTDRMRFILAYLGIERATPRVLKLAKQIAAKSTRIRLRDQRKQQRR